MVPLIMDRIKDSEHEVIKRKCHGVPDGQSAAVSLGKRVGGVRALKTEESAEIPLRFEMQS